MRVLQGMHRLRRRLALSDHWTARWARRLHRLQYTFSLPVPGIAAKPFALLYIAVRSTYFFLFRVLLAEPFFRSYCKQVGRNFHTGAHLHWVMGKGEISIGDDVMIDGRCNFFFALRYCEMPKLTIGDRTGIGHSCSFVVGREITFGRDCRIGGGVSFFDTPGHPNDPEARLRGEPARSEDVRPIQVGDNVWIGSSSTIFPGVVIGDNSVVANGSVVMTSVAENVVVAGNPARQIAKIPVPEKQST
jgi:acetyltransferase-like isoleucine patch superfamily enzyme